MCACMNVETATEMSNNKIKFAENFVIWLSKRTHTQTHTRSIERVVKSLVFYRIYTKWNEMKRKRLGMAVFACKDTIACAVVVAIAFARFCCYVVEFLSIIYRATNFISRKHLMCVFHRKRLLCHLNVHRKAFSHRCDARFRVALICFRFTEIDRTHIIIYMNSLVCRHT